jgi:hypothetical protein
VDGIFHAVATWAKRIFAGRRWLRRTVVTILIVLILYTLGGFFGVPYVLRRVLTGPVASSLKRPVTVGAIAFNPYRLRLEVANLHVGDRDPTLPFADLKRLLVKVSWKSLYRLAPIVGEFSTDGLTVHVVRTGPQQFNFSDVLEKPANAPPPPPSKPQRFAISNIRLNDGAIYFDDETLHQQHRVEDIHLAVPFIANLPADLDVFVQPFLSMVVDGSRFRLAGVTKPFNGTLDTFVNLSLHRLALAPYIAYVPAKLPIKLNDGMLSTFIQLHFINSEDHPEIKFDGGAALEKIDLRDASGAPLLSLGRGVVTLDNVEPLESVFHLKRIYIESLNAHLVRNADGTTNLSALAAGGSAASPTPRAQSSVAASAEAPAVAAASPTPKPPAGASSPTTPLAPGTIATSTPTPAVASTSPSPTPPAIAAAPTPSAAPAEQPLNAQMQLAAPSSPTPQAQSSPSGEKAPLDFELDTFEMTTSAVDLTDRSQPNPAMVAINAIHATFNQLHNVGAGLTPFALNGNVVSGGALAVKGTLDLSHEQVASEAMLNQIDLLGLKTFASPYLTGQVASGRLTAQANVKTSFASGKFNLHAEPAGALIENFDLKSPDGKAAALGWGKFAVNVGQFDLATQQAVVNEVRIDGLRVTASRDHDGQIDLVTLLRRPGSQAPIAPELRQKVEKVGRRVAERVRHELKATRPPPPVATAPTGPTWKYHVQSVVFDRAELHLVDEQPAKPIKFDIVPLDLDLKDVSNDLSKPIGIELGAIVNSKGSLKVAGSVATLPLDAKLRITTKRLDLSPVDAYLGNQVNAKIASAVLTTDGTATATDRRNRLQAGYRGDLTLGGVRILDKLTGDTFVRWNSFTANRIAADYGEGKPKVRIGGLTLADFYARVILNSDATLNVEHITSNRRAARVSLTRAGVTGAPPAATPSPAPTPAVAKSAQPVSVKPFPADLYLGGFTLEGGHINYTDNFIQPHYSANLTDVGGKIGAFSTGSTTPANVLLEGQVNGSAPLKISGSLNPLVPLAYVDIAATADGVELPELSTYSTKYTGYPIEKGTLTVDVHYTLDNQKLTATNHIVINQLTFGDKVESKTAINLPVRLAVSLLEDSNGVIDLKIPVSGSLSDPQFSVGAVIWQVIKNLLVKAITSPFSLIGGVFHSGGGAGGADLNYIMFNPGYSLITPDSGKQLDTIAKALSARPALKLDITGRVDPGVDRDALRLAKVDRQVLAEKIKDTGETENGAPVTVGKDEYDKYLKQAYKAAKFDKPRNMVGLTKSLPPDEMKKLMAAHVQITDDDLHHLADARAEAVRAGLNSRKIEPARLFVLPPKLNAADLKGQGKTTRADLTLE